MTTRPFTLTVTGKGGHGAIPAVTIDPVVAASALVRDLQILALRAGDIQIVFTGMHAGTKFNVIPNDAAITGTITYSGEESLEKMKQGLAHTAAAYRTAIDFCLE